MSKGSRNRERRHQAALAKKARKTAARQKKRARAADQAASNREPLLGYEFDNFLQYGPAKPTTIRLYQGELEKLDKFCKREKVSRSEAIRYVIDETDLLD